MSQTGDDQQPSLGAIRITRRARADIEAAWGFLAGITGEQIADAWQEGLEEAIASLAQMPGRCPIAPESELFLPPAVRQHIYRRTRSGPAYRILFRMHQSAEDAPIVRIISVRHGGQAPMTLAEAEDIERAD